MMRRINRLPPVNPMSPAVDLSVIRRADRYQATDPSTPRNLGKERAWFGNVLNNIECADDIKVCLAELFIATRDFVFGKIFRDLPCCSGVDFQPMEESSVVDPRVGPKEFSTSAANIQEMRSFQLSPGEAVDGSCIC